MTAYSYPNTIMVIADNYDNYHTACHMFANQFPHAKLISAHARVNAVHNAAHSLTNVPGAKAPTIKQLAEAHKYCMNTIGDTRYFIRDIENTMMVNEKRFKPDDFHVIVALEPMFGEGQIAQISAKKIYFYEDRSDTPKEIDKTKYCANESDYFTTLGYKGSVVNITDSVKTIYRHLMLKV